MKTYLITGAGRGIGLETTKALLAQGHQVVALSRAIHQLTDLGKNHPTLIPLPLNFTQHADREELFTTLENHHIRLSGICLNAGALVNKSISDMSEEELRLQFEVNSIAPILLVQGLLPYINSNAHLLTIGSMGGYQGSAKFPGLAVYSASKAAISCFSECFSEEFKTQGIASNSLCLGAVQTKMLEEAFPGFEAPVQPEEMGTYIAQFLTTGHRFYNGKVLPVALQNPS